MNKTLPSPAGKLIDVGGYRLHAYITGAGNPAVVFEAGSASWSLDWTLVQSEVAKFTTACSYDRAGYGWSDPGPKPRNCAQIVHELHTMLVNSGLPKPYVLVGASFGGHPVRLYARQYPDEVAGIVLLDARHEAISSKMPPAWQQMEKSGASMYQVMLLASRLNLLKILSKLMGPKSLPPIYSKLPDALKSIYLEVGFQPKYFQSNLDELAACPESDRQLEASGTLGTLPLVVIRHGIPDLFANMPAAQAQQAEQIWQELQTDLCRLSTQGQMLVAEKSGHGIQLDQPELIVDTIRQMVGTVRQA